MAARPFVKWAGGKRNLIPQLEALLPSKFDTFDNLTYIEPFVGGGAMLFYMLQNHKNIKRAVINDINPDLIHCYQLISRNPYELIERLKTIESNYYCKDINNRKELYYAYRDQYNGNCIHPDEKAALFIFLNHTCYNGLYRVNSLGKFNVPYGRYRRPVICNVELILENYHLLNSIELVIRQPGDYKLIRRNLSKRSINFIYLDPPYRPLYGSSNFKEYFNSPFGDVQQTELKKFCDKLSSQNCQIMLSNSDSKNENGTSFFEDLYKGYNFKRILAPRYINANPEKRNKLEEIVIRNYNR